MIENVIDELKDLFSDKLPAEVDAYALPQVRALLIAEQDVPPTQLPVIFILPQTTDEFTQIGPSSHDEEHALLIVVLHQHVDTQKLALELMAYKNAVRRMIMRDLPQSPVKFVIARRVVRHAYSRTREIEEGGAYSREVHLDCRFRERIGEI